MLEFRIEEHCGTQDSKIQNFRASVCKVVRARKLG